MPYAILSVRSVPKYGRNAARTGESLRQAKNNNSRRLRNVSMASENHHTRIPTNKYQQHSSTSVTHATPSSLHTVSPSFKGADRKSKGLSVPVSSPPITKRSQPTATPGQATSFREFKTDIKIEQWRDTINEELGIESVPSSFSEEYRAYEDERIDNRLYN